MSYKLSDVVAATGVPGATLLSWLDRGIIAAPKTGSGRHRSFDIRDIDRVAIINALTQLGLPVAAAAKAASAFSDDRSYRRPRAQLHADGYTALLIDADKARVVRVESKAELDDLVARLFVNDFGIIALNVSATLHRVSAALDGKKPASRLPAAAVYRHGKQLHVA
jgi:DNA-binding transcriptional MerR regulator